jgi:fatty acid synthase subunit beta
MLGKVLDVLAHHPRPESMASEELLQLVRQNLAASRQLPPVIELERGFATIPLKGIDIPFHSTLLRGEIENYRQYLKGKLAMEYIEPEQFVGKFIPNVMGKPFSITKSYVKQVADVTGSRQLLRMLQEMA